MEVLNFGYVTFSAKHQDKIAIIKIVMKVKANVSAGFLVKTSWFTNVIKILLKCQLTIDWFIEILYLFLGAVYL